MDAGGPCTGHVWCGHAFSGLYLDESECGGRGQGQHVPNPKWTSGGAPKWTEDHFIENRDWFIDISNVANSSGPTESTCTPFDGTVGVGFGTIALRPTTCTTNANELGGGVGYWATDEGEWDSTNGATADGRLYRCSATNTWTLHYTPYTYPHPLRTP